jgi:hypothetical protein
MSEIQPIITAMGHNWFAVLTAVIMVWFLVTKLVETSEGAAKLLGPLGRRIAKGYQLRSERYRKDVSDQAKLLAVELIPEVMPSDYKMVKSELSNIIDRVTALETENNAMRAFIVHDEEWHFRYDLSQAAGGQTVLVPERLSWMAFLERWLQGWRPSPLGRA